MASETDWMDEDLGEGVDFGMGADDAWSDGDWGGDTASDMAGTAYTVDIVLCIDGTGSMGHLIDETKANALRLHGDLRERMEAKGKHIDQLRLRVIVFRDQYYDQPDQCLEATPFYRLPDEVDSFSDYTSSIMALGGGPATESALEAVATALQSDWSSSGHKRRHVVVLWTDSDAYPLEHRSDDKPAHYPQGLPADFDELTDEWGSLEEPSKRIILFAPNMAPWNVIDEHWDNAVVYYAPAGEGLVDQEYGAILDAVARSI